MGEVHTEEGPKADILVLIEGRARYLAHLGHVKTPEILRGCAAEITRLRVALAEKMVVKVKPLEWRGEDSGKFYASDNLFNTLIFVNTKEQAGVKDAARAERILSAVKAVPASQIRAEALREALALGKLVEHDDRPGWANCGAWVHAVEIYAMRIGALIDAPKVTP